MCIYFRQELQFQDARDTVEVIQPPYTTRQIPEGLQIQIRQNRQPQPLSESHSYSEEYDQDRARQVNTVTSFCF